MPSVKPTITSIHTSTEEHITSACRGLQFTAEARDNGAVRGGIGHMGEQIKDLFNLNLMKYTLGAISAPRTNLREAKKQVSRIMRDRVPILMKQARDRYAKMPADEKPDALAIMVPIFFVLTKEPTDDASSAFLHHFTFEQDAFFKSQGCDHYDATWTRDVETNFCQITICAMKTV